jgi:hypothetical protein
LEESGVSKLISKKEYEDRLKASREKLQQTATGVECDKCGGELHHADDMICATYPPCRWVKCEKCGARTTITV